MQRKTSKKREGGSTSEAKAWRRVSVAELSNANGPSITFFQCGRANFRQVQKYTKFKKFHVCSNTDLGGLYGPINEKTHLRF